MSQAAKHKITDIITPDQIKRLTKAGYVIAEPGSVMLITAEYAYDRDAVCKLAPDQIGPYMAQIKTAVLSGLRARVPDEAITETSISGPWGAKIAAECYVIVPPRSRFDVVN